MHKNKEWLETEFIGNGRSADDIAKECGVTNVTIRFWARKFGLKRRRYGSKSLDDRYFEKIDTEQKAYWLGFIAADGSVQNKPGKRLLSICLSEKDVEHLLMFRTHIKSDHSIYHAHRITSFGPCRSAQLDLSSAKMVSDLSKCGIVPRKSLILSPPQIRKSLVRHWIRGYFDGDGSVSANGSFCIVGTDAVVKFIRSNLPVNLCLRKVGKCTRIDSVRKSSFPKLYNHLYKGSSIHLGRKHEIFRKLGE